jgi:amidase
MKRNDEAPQPEDLVFCTASELANFIRNGTVSAETVVEAFLAHIQAHNPALKAIVTLDEEGARKRARQADVALAEGKVWGPLHGVPVTVKDVFETAGMRTTSSHKPLANYIPEQDATVVARLLQAGAILLGKSNLPELAAGIQCNSPLFGVTNNPWDRQRTPGGSSGGEAAAVAAGLTAMGLGSDIGGSIRLPAHFCGLFALKPSERRVSNAGHIPPLPGAINPVRHMAANGPLARSVADLRLGLSVIAGPDGRDRDVAPVPLIDAPRRPLSTLRFAWSDDFGGLPISSETRDGLARLAGSLQQAGCLVERQNPADFDFHEAWRTYGQIYGAMIYSTMPGVTRFFIRRLGPLMFRDPIFRPAARSATASAQTYFAALHRRDKLINALERFLHGYDAWLCPVASVPAIEHRPPNRLAEALDVDGQKVPGSLAGLGFTCIFNLTGHPAVVVPLTQSKEGLPIGIQLIGRRWGEMALLNAAEALTEISGPFRRPPGF